MFKKGKFIWWKGRLESNFFIKIWDCPCLIVDKQNDLYDILCFDDNKIQNINEENLLKCIVYECSEKDVERYFENRRNYIRTKRNEEISLIDIDEKQANILIKRYTKA